MNDRPSDSARPPSDEAFLEQGVRALKNDFPPDDRMQSLAVRLAPVLVAEPALPRWWQRRALGIFVGAIFVVVGAGFMGRHARSGGGPPPPMRVDSLLSALSEAPAIAADAPTIAVDALPTAAPAADAPKVETKPRSTAVESAPAPSVEPHDEGDELAILEEARRALAADPGRALSLADSHAKRFRKPSFAQERERLAIDALVRLGRREDAAQRATRFEAKYPDSAHLDRVRALVAPRVDP